MDEISKRGTHGPSWSLARERRPEHRVALGAVPVRTVVALILMAGETDHPGPLHLLERHVLVAAASRASSHMCRLEPMRPGRRRKMACGAVRGRVVVGLMAGCAIRLGRRALQPLRMACGAILACVDLMIERKAPVRPVSDRER